MAALNLGCSAQKSSLVSNIDASGDKQPIEDSVLQKMQAENDLVIAFAVENFAWVKSINYRILTHNNNEWKGYLYHKNLMQNASAGSPTSMHAVTVNNAACDSLLNYITEKKAWDIKGDSGNGFCADGSKRCNINDASGSRLWIITKNAAINPSYYAPDFYESCCPEQQRGLFLSITKKITAIAGEKEETE